MAVIHNEDSRVKIPALVHFTRLGYTYKSLKESDGKYDEDTNIFIGSFRDGINNINGTNISEQEAKDIIADLKDTLNQEDLGQGFYTYLKKGYKGLKLIDFDSIDGFKNIYEVVTEFTCKNGSEEFRPDITVLVNGMPLVFIEVKKPNNKNGIQAEYERINKRFANKKFRRFANITQFMIFSNNSEYDDTEVIPLEGAFYSTTDYKKLFFSHFREEDSSIFDNISEIDVDVEKKILKDNNLFSIKGSGEYDTNMSSTTPTNRIITSMLSHERFMMLLKYAICFVDKVDPDTGIRRLEKHIMRYPQLFATKAIEKKLDDGVKKGVIWHTQGSGKTELAFYNTHYLKDYYQKQGIIAKFYFIVDRLDLLRQAADEFRSRGLVVDEVKNKAEFEKVFTKPGEKNNTGELSITVINIQKLSANAISKSLDYDLNIQRIYFLDEAHRSYNPTGSFLANLIASDRNAVMIALTGTPLISGDYNTTDVFGHYIHKYFYNSSIADRYTLRLIREGIKTEYRMSLMAALKELKAIKGSLPTKDIYAHKAYVRPLVKYIIDDFTRSRLRLNDDSIGGMIVCESESQARAVFEEIKSKNYKVALADEQDDSELLLDKDYSCALILHDEDDKDTRAHEQNEFKQGQIDFLVVYRMLLTGFDANRLKKLYLCRKITEHNLLQALTRVNRPYKNYRYGYVVDFADIRKEFDKTNKAYFEELQQELGDAFEEYNNILKGEDEIKKELDYISEKLFLFDTENAEIFSQQISELEKSELIEVRKAIELYKELANLSKLYGYDDLANRFTLDNIKSLYNEVTNRINIVNQKEALANAEDMSAILNMALDGIDFRFHKVSESEMVIADKFRESLEHTRAELQRNNDPKDPEYVLLVDELQRLFAKKNIEELTAEEMDSHIKELNRIEDAAKKKNLADAMLARKYNGDLKYMRTHKRLREGISPVATDIVLNRILLSVKNSVDKQVYDNENVLDNEPYFQKSMYRLILKEFNNNDIRLNAQNVKEIGNCISEEYFHERTWK
ncbi:type I restriction endonuclease [Pseudobutyrivibrio xylanivorans]|uniref:type I site-specific deoxyribonuclease n=1 Tax=Pseudobutyrivibrio xylanivorans TaxID=185007 RepID=A0A5P6VLT9_PSEXY|nr:type I restriction endonuclease [Pseudobutyrivibrio xylanivorans]QFJ53380.1 type I restriction endonuclease subunit R [Pseudobutyrivibrio xylanivorans]QFJ53457.1 type I restriction endonuclease subunit R [Pseudobutyrivibrio xylanivorans]